jgi:hypothetical protein
LGERVLCKHEVIGSIPFTSTTLVRGGSMRRGEFGLSLGVVPGAAWFFDRVNRV